MFLSPFLLFTVGYHCGHSAVTWSRSYTLIIILIVSPVLHANVLLSLKCSDSQLPFWKVSHSSVSYSVSRIGSELLCGPMVRVYVAF